MRIHTRRYGRGAVIAAAAVIAVVASACSSSGGDAASKAPTGSSSTPGDVSAASTSSSASGSTGGDPLAAAKADVAKFASAVSSYPKVDPLSGVTGLKGKTIWYVPIGSVPILTSFGVGITAALKAAGIQTHICDGKFVPTSMASCLNQAVSQGADGVIAGYIDYKLVPTAYDNLVTRHVPVLIAGEAPPEGKTSSPQLAFYDSTELGNRAQQLDMEAVMADSGGKAKILFLGVTDSATTAANAAFAKSFIAKNCPGCSFKEVDYNTASLAKVASQVSAALISNPDTTYVVDELDSGSAATISGIQTSGFTNKVKLASVSGNLDALQRVKAGGLQVVDVGYSAINLGWQYADGVLRMLLGHVPTVGQGVLRVFSKSNVADLTLTPDAYATNAWYGTDAYKQTFTSAWGV